MHDFFVSYAHEEAERAQAVARRLRELGQTVWLDEAVDGGHLAGIPAGQRHWDVIAAGIDQAAAFLILDSPAWRRSEYCRRELKHARGVGKRVAALGYPGELALDGVHVAVAEDPAVVVGELEPGNEAARAHARLHADMVAGGRRRSWRTTLLQTGEQSRDAELVTAADPAVTGLSVEGALTEFCRQLLDAARRRRRIIRTVLTVGVAVLVVLAVVAIIGRQTTIDSRDQAAQAAARAVSLQLAQQARSAPSTATGLDLADRAVASDPTAAARSVLSQLQSRSDYLRYTTARPNTYVAAAVSADGTTAVLAGVDSFVVADLTTGETRVLPAPDLVQPDRLALAPDGTRAYAATQTGDMLCVDVPARNIRLAATADVADLSVAADGSLWWATTGGDVAHADGCPGDSSADRYQLPSSVAAFAVLSEGVGLAVLSTDYVLSTYTLPPTPAAGTTQLAARSGVPMEGLPTDSSRAWSVDADERGPDQIIVCGTTIHVAAKTVGLSAVSTTWYAGFDDAGLPLGSRMSIGTIHGLACSPTGTAWAVPGLSTQPRALPAGSQYPVGVVDDQDAGTLLAIADSADHGRTVVAHASGRVEVFDPSASAWGRAAGQATVAVPLGDATVTVDEGGTVRRMTATTETVLGRLDGPTQVGAVAALPGRVLLGSGSSVVEVTDDGPGASVRLPVPVTSLTVSADGSDLVVQGGDQWFTVPASLDGAVEALTPPVLNGSESISSLSQDRDRLVTGTTFGRLIVSTLDGETLHTTRTGVAGPMTSFVLPNHDIVAMGQDGILRSFDWRLHPRDSVMFGAGGFVMRGAADGGTLVLALTDFSVWAVDPGTLKVQQAIGVRSDDVRRVLPSPDSSRVVRVIPAYQGSDFSEPAAVETLQLRLDD